MKPGDTLTRIATSHGVSVAEVAAANQLRDPDRIAVGQVLRIPGERRQRRGAVRAAGAVAPPISHGKALGRLRLRWPLEPPIRLSSPFGMRNGKMHNGIDLLAPEGTPVLAAAHGEVLMVGDTSDPIGRAAGNYVALAHDGGIQTFYFHNQRVLVRPGQRVRAGQRIATVGNTGRTHGGNGAFHLHFEVRVGADPIDPLPYLPPLK